MSGVSCPPQLQDFSSFLSVTMLSVVNIIAATDAAFCRALLDTFVGSTIPAFFISTYSSLPASNPTPIGEAFTFSNITAGSSPAFIAICLTGSCNALRTILPPSFSSFSRPLTNFSTSGNMFTNAVPPPATIPSSTAAFVADNASSILFVCFYLSCSS